MLARGACVFLVLQLSHQQPTTRKSIMQATGKIVENLVNALGIKSCNLTPDLTSQVKLLRKYKALKAKGSKNAQAAFTEWFFACCGLSLQALQAIKNGSAAVQCGRSTVFNLQNLEMAVSNETAMIVGSLGDGKKMKLKALWCKVL